VFFAKSAVFSPAHMTAFMMVRQRHKIPKIVYDSRQEGGGGFAMFCRLAENGE